MLILLVLFVFEIQSSNGLASPLTPYTTYNHSVELAANVSDLFWTVDETNKTILFELHIKTTGWIALGISPGGGMTGADIGVGWVNQNGTVYFQDRYAVTTATPLLDNTTTDWFALQGREQNGWTAIQFKRLIDTCDSMDVAIKSGTNYLIFAYGDSDPNPNPFLGDITYHFDRRGQAILSLRSYSDPPLESKFAQLDYFDFQIKNYSIPATDTTYLCKVFKAPANYTTKRHVIAHKTIINSTETDRVHHLLMYECSPSVQFDDSNLPDGDCDIISVTTNISYCLANIATGWAVGGDLMSEFPTVAGYPVGGNFSVKYYVVQMHYDNPKLCTNCVDNSGIRFYVSNELRQYDIGYLTLGTDSSAVSLSLPPEAQTFSVDSYCPLNASSLLPATGITILSAFPHTHLQGKSVWTKLIRNKTAVQYLFNAESYNFSYQFQNNLPQPIQLYPGDEFLTRCVYTTMNKNIPTFGGERTKEEMCLHMFTYYPRVNNLYTCLSRINIVSWRNFLKNPTLNVTTLQSYITNLTWTSNLTADWQNFYNNASRIAFYGRAGSFTPILQSKLPDYVDLKQDTCSLVSQNSSSSTTQSSSSSTTQSSSSSTTQSSSSSTTQSSSSSSTTQSSSRSTTTTSTRPSTNSTTTSSQPGLVIRHELFTFLLFLSFFYSYIN